MKVEFKIAGIEDVKAIIDLCNECFFEETPLEYAMDVFNKTKDDPNQIYLVGIMDEKIIAHVKLTIIPTIYKEMNTYCILNHVCVKPEYRRHHVAKAMLSVCERIAKEHGCVKMELWSNNKRQPAHACYKRFGFVVDDAKFFSKVID